MIRISLVLFLLTIATSRITDAADPAFAGKYFGAMESRPVVSAKAPTTAKATTKVKAPVKNISQKPTPRELHLADQARHRAQYAPPPKVTFDGVYYWNEAGEAVAMKVNCKACRIGR
jgi:hypothetical protein